MRWNVLGKLSNQCYSSKNRATAISSLSMLISLIYLGSLGVFALLNHYSSDAIRSILLIMSACSVIFLLPIAFKLQSKYHGGALEKYD